MSTTSFCETVVQKYTILAHIVMVEASNLFRVQQQLFIRHKRHALMRMLDFGETVVNLKRCDYNDAITMATKLNSDLVSRCRLYSMAHHAHDSAAGFCEPPYLLMSSSLCAINRNTAKLFAATKTQLMRKCLQRL